MRVSDVDRRPAGIESRDPLEDPLLSRWADPLGKARVRSADPHFVEVAQADFEGSGAERVFHSKDAHFATATVLQFQRKRIAGTHP